MTKMWVFLLLLSTMTSSIVDAEQYIHRLHDGKESLSASKTSAIRTRFLGERRRRRRISRTERTIPSTRRFSATEATLFQSRGGGGGGGMIEQKQQSPSKATATTAVSSRSPSPTKVLTALLVAGFSWYAYQQRDVWLPLLLDKQKLQQAVVQVLEGLRPPPAEGDTVLSLWSRYRGYVGYTAAMAFWELLGLSTIPVETAAAMVFSWPAAVASATGKLLGASTAFWIGRTWLQDVVEAKFGSNPTLQMMRQQSAQRHAPWLSALLMKFSCFPETIKNYGTAAFLPSVNFVTFWGATFFHGVTFTLLWTWLGVETAGQLESSGTTATATTAGSAAAAASTTTATSWELQLALGAMLVCGFVLSPASMAWWVRDLRRGAKEQEGEEKKKRKWFIAARRQQQ